MSEFECSDLQLVGSVPETRGSVGGHECVTFGVAERSHGGGVLGLAEFDGEGHGGPFVAGGCCCHTPSIYLSGIMCQVVT